MAIPKKVEERIKRSVKQFQPVLESQRDRDVSEADTVTLVKDLFADVFGYDKYAELTSEHAIRGTYCDLAVKIDGKLRLLVEVKAIGIRLDDRHIKQAVDYAANQGLDWVVLTNSIHWLLFQVHFGKPIEAKQVAEFNCLDANLRSATDLEKLYLLTREGFLRGALDEYTEQQAATSRYLLAGLLLHDDDVVGAIRRELRRITGRLVEGDDIKRVLRQEVLKREVQEGDEAKSAARLVARRDKKKPAKKKASASKQKPPSTETAGPTSTTS